MITFRYHIVSLVAVFLALGIGVLAGTSFFSQATVSALQGSLKRLDERNESLRKQLEATQKRTDGLLEFAGQSKELLVRDALKDRPVVVVSVEGTPDQLVDQVHQTMIQAGARLEGSIQLSAKLDLATDSRRQQAALALEVPTADADQLRALLLERLGASLSGRNSGIVQRLVDAGLARALEVPGGRGRPASALAGPGTAVVFLGPVPDRRARLPLGEPLVMPLVRQLASAGVLIAVAEPGSDPLDLVAQARQDAALRAVTVDGVDGAVGQTALALGLRAAAAGRFGHYGSGDGAAGLMPEPSPTPR